MNVFALAVLGTALAVAPVLAAPAPNTSINAAGDPSPAASDFHVADHLTLGTRLTYFVLMHATDHSFLGTISRLDERQDCIPWKLFADWQFTPQWGLELTWDEMKTHTVTRVADHHSDGEFKVQGPILDAVYQIHRFRCCTPYAQFGLAWMLGDFDPARWWALGYSHEEDWTSLGSPDQVRSGITRNISLDDALGVVAAAGIRFGSFKHWSGDLLLRYMHLENDATFNEYRKGVRITGDDNTIPLSNLALGLGLAYSF